MDKSVLLMAAGLSCIGFGSLFFLAYLKWKLFGTIVFFVMDFAGVIILFITLFPAYRMYKDNQQRAREWEERKIMNRLKGHHDYENHY